MMKSMFMKIYIIPMIMYSPLLMMSCNSWFSIWMIMELNLMSFIPFIIFYNKYYKELSIKYFIIQAISSSIIIFSSNMMFMNFFNMKIITIIMINLSLIMKMGAPPFHNWFVNMMNNMNWLNCLVLSTWQKIIPIISLMYIYNMYMIYMITFLSSVIGAIFSLNHQSLRIIFSYSSINHLSWIFMNLMISEMLCSYYFLIYSILNCASMLMFHKMNYYYLNQIFSFNSNYNSKFIIFMNLLSISGFPPMLGFSMKWISIYYMNLNLIQNLLLIMILMSIFSFIYYIRICINLLLNYSLMNKFILAKKFNTNNNLNYFIFFSSSINLWFMSIWMY